MALLEDLRWRYATKKFDPTKKVDQETVDKIVEAAWLAPTSSGLQPYVVLEITNQELKEKMVAVAAGQQQLADCSHVLVFAAWDNYTEERIDNIYAHTTIKRNQPVNRYKNYTDTLKNSYIPRNEELNFNHVARQSYIALAFAMAVAAELKVDTTPMEGFNNQALDELLDLKQKGLKSVTILPLGYRDEENDWMANLAKVRHPLDEFLIKIQ